MSLVGVSFNTERVLDPSNHEEYAGGDYMEPQSGGGARRHDDVDLALTTPTRLRTTIVPTQKDEGVIADTAARRAKLLTAVRPEDAPSVGRSHQHSDIENQVPPDASTSQIPALPSRGSSYEPPTRIVQPQLSCSLSPHGMPLSNPFNPSDFLMHPPFVPDAPSNHLQPQSGMRYPRQDGHYHQNPEDTYMQPPYGAALQHHPPPQMGWSGDMYRVPAPTPYNYYPIAPPARTPPTFSPQNSPTPGPAGHLQSPSLPPPPLPLYSYPGHSRRSPGRSYQPMAVDPSHPQRSPGPSFQPTAGPSNIPQMYFTPPTPVGPHIAEGARTLPPPLRSSPVDVVGRTGVGPAKPTSPPPSSPPHLDGTAMDDHESVESDSSGGMAPVGCISNANHKIINDGFVDIQKMFRDLAHETGLSIQQVTSLYTRANVTNSVLGNSWNMYQKFFAANEGTELGRVTDLVETKGMESKERKRIILLCYKAFQKRYGKAWVEFLETWTESEIYAAGNQTVAQRGRTHKKVMGGLVRKLEAIATMYSIESSLVCCGNVVQQDGVFGRSFTTKGAAGFFETRCLANDDEIVGHFQAHIQDRSSRVVAKARHDKLVVGGAKVTKDNKRELQIPSGSRVKEGSEDGESVTSKAELAMLKSMFKEKFLAVKPDAVWPTKFPWKMLPKTLADEGIVMVDYSENTPFPGQDAKKGISGLKGAERKRLMSAFSDPTRPVHFRCAPACDTEDLLTALKPVIIGIQRGDGKRSRCMFMDGSMGHTTQRPTTSSKEQALKKSRQPSEAASPSPPPPRRKTRASARANTHDLPADKASAKEMPADAMEVIDVVSSGSELPEPISIQRGAEEYASLSSESSDYEELAQSSGKKRKPNKKCTQAPASKRKVVAFDSDSEPEIVMVDPTTTAKLAKDTGSAGEAPEQRKVDKGKQKESNVVEDGQGKKEKKGEASETGRQRWKKQVEVVIPPRDKIGPPRPRPRPVQKSHAGTSKGAAPSAQPLLSNAETRDDEEASGTMKMRGGGPNPDAVPQPSQSEEEEESNPPRLWPKRIVKGSRPGTSKDAVPQPLGLEVGSDNDEGGSDTWHTQPRPPLKPRHAASNDANPQLASPAEEEDDGNEEPSPDAYRRMSPRSFGVAAGKFAKPRPHIGKGVDGAKARTGALIETHPAEEGGMRGGGGAPAGLIEEGDALHSERAYPPPGPYRNHERMPGAYPPAFQGAAYGGWQDGYEMDQYHNRGPPARASYDRYGDAPARFSNLPRRYGDQHYGEPRNVYPGTSHGFQDRLPSYPDAGGPNRGPSRAPNPGDGEPSGHRNAGVGPHRYGGPSRAPDRRGEPAGHRDSEQQMQWQPQQWQQR